ncbi:hypothetical protein Purlil1_8148 [Purpureocillium lilacinum]|uniref:Uncharacterized protein n=1 Tax=Purpureocillium lilacinum TaxID=33203 RepID=A0ABR0BVV1_PURLI|nr:hypothetical protein Purlil1_8148 [Purpureocillium lilacinum]
MRALLFVCVYAHSITVAASSSAPRRHFRHVVRAPLQRLEQPTRGRGCVTVSPPEPVANGAESEPEGGGNVAWRPSAGAHRFACTHDGRRGAGTLGRPTLAVFDVHFDIDGRAEPTLPRRRARPAENKKGLAMDGPSDGLGLDFGYYFAASRFHRPPKGQWQLPAASGFLECGAETARVTGEPWMGGQALPTGLLPIHGCFPRLSSPRSVCCSFARPGAVSETQSLPPGPKHPSKHPPPPKSHRPNSSASPARAPWILIHHPQLRPPIRRRGLSSPSCKVRHEAAAITRNLAAHRPHPGRSLPIPSARRVGDGPPPGLRSTPGHGS